MVIPPREASVIPGVMPLRVEIYLRDLDISRAEDRVAGVEHRATPDVELMPRSRCVRWVIPQHPAATTHILESVIVLQGIYFVHCIDVGIQSQVPGVVEAPQPRFAANDLEPGTITGAVI